MATYHCPSLQPFPSIGGGAHRVLETAPVADRGHRGDLEAGGAWLVPYPGRSLTKKKKVFLYPGFPKMNGGTQCVGGGRLAVGDWRLVAVCGGWWWLTAVGGWGLVVDGGWSLLAVGGWSLLAVGGWRLAVGAGLRLATGGGRWLAVDGPLGRSLRAVLNKKKTSVPKDRPAPTQAQSVVNFSTRTFSNSSVLV